MGVVLGTCYATDASGWTSFTASGTAQNGYNGAQPASAGTTMILYVSSSTGRDPGDTGYVAGTAGSSATPYRTVQAALAVACIRSGNPTAAPDWILLKKGDTWPSAGPPQGGAPEVTGYLLGNFQGVSSNEPAIIGAYDPSNPTVVNPSTGGNRPVINCKGAGGFNGIYTQGYPSINTGGSNIAIVGIEIYCYTRDPNNGSYDGTTIDNAIVGISLINPCAWVLIEDCKVWYFDGDNISINPSTTFGATGSTISGTTFTFGTSGSGNDVVKAGQILIGPGIPYNTQIISPAGPLQGSAANGSMWTINNSLSIGSETIFGFDMFGTAIIRRCVVTDAYSIYGSYQQPYSSGLAGGLVRNLLQIEENTLDSNGWNATLLTTQAVILAATGNTITFPAGVVANTLFNGAQIVFASAGLGVYATPFPYFLTGKSSNTYNVSMGKITTSTITAGGSGYTPGSGTHTYSGVTLYVTAAGANQLGTFVNQSFTSTGSTIDNGSGGSGTILTIGTLTGVNSNLAVGQYLTLGVTAGTMIIGQISAGVGNGSKWTVDTAQLRTATAINGQGLPTADVTVTNGAVTSVSINASCPGTQWRINDQFTIATLSDIGGTGSGWYSTVTGVDTVTVSNGSATAWWTGTQRLVRAHNTYIGGFSPIGEASLGPQNTGGLAVTLFRGNILANDSSGSQFRSGGTIDNNLNIANPYPHNIGAPIATTNYVTNNVYVDGVNSQGQTASGIADSWGPTTMANNYEGDQYNIGAFLFDGNIVANTQGDQFAPGIQVYDSLVTGVTISNNIIFNWGAGAGNPNPGNTITLNGATATVTNNQQDGVGTNNNPGGLAPKEPFPHPLPVAPGSTSLIGDYNYYYGTGVATSAAFLTQVRLQSKANWNPVFTADVVNDQIGAWFGIFETVPVVTSTGPRSRRVVHYHHVAGT